MWELRIRKENLKRKLGEENKEKILEKLKSVMSNKKRIRRRKEKWRKFERELKEAGENVDDIFSYAINLIPEKKPIRNDGIEAENAENEHGDPDVNLHPENDKSLQNVRQKSDSGSSLLGSDNHYKNN